MPFTVGFLAAKDGAGTTIPGGMLAADIAGGNVGPWILFKGIVDGIAGSTRLGVYAEDAAADANPTGLIMMGVRRDTLSASEVSTDGDNVALKATNKGELRTSDADILARLPTALSAGSLKTLLHDGTNAAVIKAASTPAAASDPAIVVAISPNGLNVNGRAADADSAPMALSTENVALLGALTETAPASDTASSGLNGRLQRVAQNITALTRNIGAADATTLRMTSTPNLWGTGTNNDGLLTSLLSLQTTEMNALANAAVIVSSVGGASGIFDVSNTGAAVHGELYLTLGAIGVALSAGANLSGWFLTSPDDGSTFEPTTVAASRPPDFVIPLPATTIGAGTMYKAAGLVPLPSLPFKVLVQNNTGQAFAATTNTLKVAPVSMHW